MATWSITTDGPRYLLRKDRSRAVEPCDDLEDALRRIRPKFVSRDKVVLVEADGYRTVITNQVARRGWRGSNDR